EGGQLVEGSFAEVVVVVVDLAGPLGGDDHQRVAGVDVLEQGVYAWGDHEPGMVPAAASSLRTMLTSSSTARSISSLATTWPNEPACGSWVSARSSRSPISPALSVARSRSRRSSSWTGAVTKIVTAVGIS